MLGNIVNTKESIVMAQIIRYALQRVEQCLVDGNQGIAKDKIGLMKAALNRVELGCSDTMTAIEDIKKTVVG